VNLSVTVRPQARRDVLEHIQYLEEQANDETAVRYYDAVVTSCRETSKQPLSGRVCHTRVGRLEGLRRSRVTGAFSKYLSSTRQLEPVLMSCASCTDLAI
jgi:plasmid stabilization system protein ParE